MNVSLRKSSFLIYRIALYWSIPSTQQRKRWSSKEMLSTWTPFELRFPTVAMRNGPSEELTSPGRWVPIAANVDNCQLGPASTTRAKIMIDVRNQHKFANLKQFVLVFMHLIKLLLTWVNDQTLFRLLLKSLALTH